MFNNAERNALLRPEILRHFISGVMTDDERAALFDLPAGCRMREGAKILSRELFACGEYVWIGEGAVLDASGGLDIGAHTSIGLNVMVWSHSSHLANLAMNNEIGSALIERKRTRIGSGCFIAGPSVIYPGVTIGDRVMVLPMSVVTRDVPSGSLVAGSPAVVKRELTQEFIDSEVERVLGRDTPPATP
jgi:acetyltransferase-like isoleucine patch superfamily enzyme